MITTLAPADSCDRSMFVPTVLPTGIEASDDSILKEKGGRLCRFAGAAKHLGAEAMTGF